MALTNGGSGGGEVGKHFEKISPRDPCDGLESIVLTKKSLKACFFTQSHKFLLYKFYVFTFLQTAFIK